MITAGCSRSFSSPFTTASGSPTAVARPAQGRAGATLRISRFDPWVGERDFVIAFSMVRGVREIHWTASQPNSPSPSKEQSCAVGFVSFARWSDAWEARERLLSASPLGPHIQAEVLPVTTEEDWNCLDQCSRLDTLNDEVMGRRSFCSFLDSESFEEQQSSHAGLSMESCLPATSAFGPLGTGTQQRSMSLSCDSFHHTSQPMHSTLKRHTQGSPLPLNPAYENAPCNTLYVGNLPPTACEEELREMFCTRIGYKRLSFKNKPNGPMCFVEFEDIHCATLAMNELYGQMLSNSCRAGIRLSYSKNPLGVKPLQPGQLSQPQVQRGPCMTLQPVDLIPRISPLY